MGRYNDPIRRVLAAYASGPGLVDALEVLIKTAEDAAAGRARDEVASTVCEGLHEGPAGGLKCRACYDAEQLLPMEMQVKAEMTMARQRLDDELVVEATLVD